MWHWDQGHLAYFQFDNLKAIARFVVSNDFKAANRRALQVATGLSFSAPDTHSPWRNYSRTLKLSLLVSERGDVAEPTPIAGLLATVGAVTTDEYLHFLAQVSSEPSPALTGWDASAPLRFPLLFALKYVLAKVASGINEPTPVDEIIGAYRTGDFNGSEDQAQFISLQRRRHRFEALGSSTPMNLRRQAQESVRVLCQISYLFLSSAGVIVTLAPSDATSVFDDLEPVGGPRKQDGNDEIRRLAQLFRHGSVHEFFEFPHTVLSPPYSPKVS